MNTRIRQVRKQSGLNQDDFASKIGLTKNFISLVESGKREPSPRTVSDICRVFNVDKTWLTTGEGEMFLPKSAEDEIADYVAKVTGTEPDDIQRRFIHAMAQLDPEEWKVVEKFTDAINN